MTAKKKGPLLVKSWDEMYEELVAYHKAHDGQINKIPQSTHLGRWLNRNRREQRKILTEEQFDKLDRLGVTWEKQADKNERRWQVMYQLLLDYRRKYDHPNVIRSEVFQGEKLGMWVCTQRNMYRDGLIKAHRQKLLNEIGFKWLTGKQQGWKEDRDVSKNRLVGITCTNYSLLIEMKTGTCSYRRPTR